MAPQHYKKGFTIIEVVLVLAIAGLIFLIVFITLPAMQRGQRDDAGPQLGDVVDAVGGDRGDDLHQCQPFEVANHQSTG